MADHRDDDAVTLLELPEIAFPEDNAELGPVTARVSGIVLGRLVALRAPKWGLVTLNGCGSRPPVRARRLTELTAADEGREVALMFEGGDPEKPVIIGCVGQASSIAQVTSKDPIEIDAESIVFQGDREVVLRCGEASITLRKDGRIVVRGAYVETRSSGVNRIKGGSVQIN